MSGPWWGRGRWRSTPASGLMVLCMIARVSGHSMSHCPVTSHCLVTVLSSLQSQYLLSSLITARLCAVTRCSVRGPGRASTDSGRSGGAGGAARPHYGQDWAGWAGMAAMLGGHRSPAWHWPAHVDMEHVASRVKSPSSVLSSPGDLHEHHNTGSL